MAKNAGADDRKRFRGAIATMVCSGLEFYDIAIFAFFAFAIGHKFFPSSDPEVEILSSLAVFGATFVARPFGSILIGAYADRCGRRAALSFTAGAMALSTAAIALMPGYAEIGMTAPIAIVVARLVQGFAFGGEIGPSTALVYEIASERRRYLYASWQPAGQGIAMLAAGVIGILLSTFLSHDELADWGWRIPFGIGSFLLWVSFLCRRGIPETIAAPSNRRIGTLSEVRHFLTGHRRRLAGITLQIVFGTVAIYTCTFMSSYLLQTLSVSTEVSFIASAVVGISVGLGSIAGGLLADMHGPTKVMHLSRIALLFLTYPVFVVAQSSLYGLFTLSCVIPFLAMISAGASFGAMVAALPETARSTGLSVIYAIVVCIFGGSTQFVMALLISTTGDPLVPAYVLMFITLLGVAGVPLLTSARRSVALPVLD